MTTKKKYSPEIEGAKNAIEGPHHCKATLLNRWRVLEVSGVKLYGKEFSTFSRLRVTLAPRVHTDGLHPLKAAGSESSSPCRKSHRWCRHRMQYG